MIHLAENWRTACEKAVKSAGAAASDTLEHS
jgi:hypothetical protein